MLCNKIIGQVDCKGRVSDVINSTIKAMYLHKVDVKRNGASQVGRGRSADAFNCLAVHAFGHMLV
jgi:hypothetical protein